MRVLTWNLRHGRAVPDVPRSLRSEFAAALAGWDWDVALLQEVPPWWVPALAQACDAQQRTVRTARHELLWLRRLIADRRPDLIRSGGGGSNAILVRGAGIAEHRWARLRWWPERRVVHGVRLETGAWCANLHAQVRPHTLTREDVAEAHSYALAWSAGAPLVLGGDFNLRDAQVPGLARAGSSGVDHVFVRGLEPVGARVLERGALSDHAPLLVEISPTPSAAMPDH